MTYLKFVIENNIIKGAIVPFKEKNKHNVGQILLNSLVNNGNKVAEIKAETGEQRTFTQIKDDSIRCALWLKKQGIGPGDIIPLCTHNQLDACIPGLAIFYVGATYTAWYQGIELKAAREYIQLVQPKIIFACESSVDVLLKAAELEKIPVKIIVFGKYPNMESLTNIMSLQSNKELQAFKPQEIDNPQEIATIIFSSGTSGRPKAVSLSYDSLLDNMFNFFPQTTCISLTYSSLGWISGTFLTFKFLLSGSTAILHDNFDPDETFKIIDHYKVDYTFLTPFMMAYCCKADVLKKYKLDSLKTIITGSTMLNPENYLSFKRNFPKVDIIQAYGLTELGSLITHHTEQCKRIDSTGYILPNRQLKIVDITTGQTLGPNQSGEICLKSPGMMLGYFKNPTATKEAIDEEGWLHSGDVGYYDDDGEIFIIDRVKDIMKCRDQKMSPSEFEKLLLKHPAVMEIAVVPVPHDIDIERPMAFVKKVPGAVVSEEELIELSSTLGSNIKLWGGVKFLDELPHTTSGKICRGQLKEMAINLKQM